MRAISWFMLPLMPCRNLWEQNSFVQVRSRKGLSFKFCLIPSSKWKCCSLAGMPWRLIFEQPWRICLLAMRESSFSNHHPMLWVGRPNPLLSSSQSLVQDNQTTESFSAWAHLLLVTARASVGNEMLRNIELTHPMRGCKFTRGPRRVQEIMPPFAHYLAPVGLSPAQRGKQCSSRHHLPIPSH